MIYLFIGRRQLGKTTLAYSMTTKCPKRIILDPRKQIHTGGYRVDSIAAFDHALERFHAFGEHDELSEILITPEDDVMPMFARASIAVREWGKDYERSPRSTHRLMFLVDEAALFDLQASAAFRYILRAVPPDLVNVGLTAHRPKDIPTDVRAIADHWMIFRTVQEHDLSVIESRTSVAVARRAASLNPHQFVHWNDASASMAAFLEPATWYIKLDSGRVSEPAEIHPPGGHVDPVPAKATDLFGER